MSGNWQKKYNLAKAYYEENGNLKIPTTYVSEDGTKLGAWIFMQRQAYKNRNIPESIRTSTLKPLTDEQVRLLEAIGMIWQIKEMGNNKDKWQRKYDLAKAYYEKNGNLEVPMSYIDEDGTYLGVWISSQRKAYKNRNVSEELRTSSMKPLTDEQVEMLESIGMIWQILEVGNREDNWQRKYNLAKEYYEQNGNLKIPYCYVCEDGTKLGEWISSQRYCYKNRKYTGKKLTDKQIEMLENIGMMWQIIGDIEDNWQSKYNMAKSYYEIHGDLRIPTTFVSEDGIKLGAWIHHQRQAYKNRIIPEELRTNNLKPLTDEQVELLDDIEMIWSFREEKTITKLNQIKIEKMFLKVLNNYVKKNKNEIVSYEDINNIEQEFMEVLFHRYNNMGKQKIK